MATLREVKNRIRSVKNIAQITRALEAVSASRVRRAQARVLASRAYSEKAWEILINIQAASKGTPLHPLLTSREEVNKVMVVVVTSDRGLAGAYHTNVLRVAQRFATRLGKPVNYVTVGRKGRDSLARSGANIIADFGELSSEPRIADVAPIARIAIDAYLSGEVDEVLIAYTDFINMLAQRPAVLGWLPLTTDTVAQQVASDFVKDVAVVSGGASDYEYEPTAGAVVDEIVPRFTELQLYQAVLEAQASEHAARMAAMKNATDNATQLTGDLTLQYNKARQAAITAEILDIVGGANALQQAIDNTAAQMMGAFDENYSATAGTPVQPGEVARTSVNGSSNGKSSVTKTTKAKSSKSKPSKSKAKGDDLTLIEGIGPKMSKALTDAGIGTFAKLADASEDDIKSAIEAAGMRFAPSLVTWAEQAALARDGKWDELEKLQDSLEGGRRA